MASFGSGKPVIAILGEFDALPGLSQKTGALARPGREWRRGPRLRDTTCWARVQRWQL